MFSSSHTCSLRIADNSIAFGRTTTEVLKIVYLGGNGKGGFFPKGAL